MSFLEHFQEYNKTPENIFQNIFWNATKYLKIFSFPKNSISGKYFTGTKHSLSVSLDCVEMKFQHICIFVSRSRALFMGPTSYLIQQNFH